MLVDHDVFLPENIVRHTLDWRNVGEHKVEAVRAAMRVIAGDIQVDIASVHLTGQESTAVVSSVLDQLGTCDLLIDATADPSTFNVLTAAAKVYGKPMVWMEVYAGGVGGFIARSRPGQDPDPQAMRAVYNSFCMDHPPPLQNVVGNYAVDDNESHIMTASDADVAIIAHHAARLALDTLLTPTPSTYDHSLYLIGLSRWWVFEAPFDTIPIATDVFRHVEAGPDLSAAMVDAGFSFIQSLIEHDGDANSTSR